MRYTHSLRLSIRRIVQLIHFFISYHNRIPFVNHKIVKIVFSPETAFLLLDSWAFCFDLANRRPLLHISEDM